MNYRQAIEEIVGNRGIEQRGKIFRAYTYVDGVKFYLGNYDEWTDANQAVINFWIDRFICNVSNYGLNPNDGVVIMNSYVIFPNMQLFNLNGREITYDIGPGGRSYIVSMNRRQYSIKKIYEKVFGNK